MESTKSLQQTSEQGVELLPLAKHLWSIVDEHVKDGRFQRSLSMVAAGSSLISGLEVGYEHYKGSYGNRMMYTPVALSAILTAAAGAGVFSPKVARTWMRWTSAATLIDGLIGFGFHVRGIQRKPGGWRLPLTNIIMGPPIFAPLLFGTAAYLSFVASYLRVEEDEKLPAPNTANEGRTDWRRELSEGQFQRHMAAVAAVWTLFSGAEAWYSHYKSGFRIWAQWTPLAISPIQFAACLAAVFSERAAQKVLPATSAITLVNGGMGFFYHVRGVVRRPGKTKHWLYNILYGPPVFAPLLFSACGALGILASLLRREKH